MDMSSDRFPRRAPGEEAETLPETLLIRAAMEQATDGAPALPDLVSAAVLQGRGRRTRARAAIGAGVTGVVALGVFGAVLPLWGVGGGTEPTGTWSTASSSTGISPSPVRTSTPSPLPTGVASRAPTGAASRAPERVDPVPGAPSMTGLPGPERARQEEFRQRAAMLLGELLPREFGPVRPVPLTVSRYQGGTDGNVFPVVLSVRPEGEGTARPEPTCRDRPDRSLRCKRATLPGGIEAQAVTTVTPSKHSRPLTGTTVRFTYGHSTVALSVDGDRTTNVSPPVTADQLLAVAGSSGFLELVKHADDNPIEAKESAERVD